MDYRIVFGGDAHGKTWEHILSTHKTDLADVNLFMLRTTVELLPDPTTSQTF